jgi:hypothetical protein
VPAAHRRVFYLGGTWEKVGGRAALIMSLCAILGPPAAPSHRSQEKRGLERARRICGIFGEPEYEPVGVSGILGHSRIAGQDARFCVAMQRAINTGLENPWGTKEVRPEPRPESEHRRVRSTHSPGDGCRALQIWRSAEHCRSPPARPLERASYPLSA